MFDPATARLIEDYTEAVITYLQHGRKPELKPDTLDYPELSDEDLVMVAVNTEAMIAGIAQRQ
jgi:hypothetical protein